MDICLDGPWNASLLRALLCGANKYCIFAPPKQGMYHIRKSTPVPETREISWECQGLDFPIPSKFWWTSEIPLSSIHESGSRQCWNQSFPASDERISNRLKTFLAFGKSNSLPLSEGQDESKVVPTKESWNKFDQNDLTLQKVPSLKSTPSRRKYGFPIQCLLSGIGHWFLSQNWHLSVTSES